MKNESNFSQWMEEGQRAVSDHDWKHAEFFFRRAVLEKPEDYQALTNLGYGLLRLGKLDEAKNYYVKSLKQSKENPEPYEYLATIYQKNNEIDQAVELFLHSAYLYLKNGEINRSVQIYQKVTDIYPDNLKVHSRIEFIAEKMNWKSLGIYENLFLGSILQESGDSKEAFEKINKAVSIDPQNEFAIKAFKLISSNEIVIRPNIEEFDLFTEKTSNEDNKIITPNEGVKEVREDDEKSNHPLLEARLSAVIELANILSENSFELIAPTKKTESKLISFFKGKEKTEEEKILIITKNIGKVIDFQSREMFNEAIEELKSAIGLGLSHPAVNFLLAYLYIKTNDPDKANPLFILLSESGKYTFPANLMISKYHFEKKLQVESLVHALKALKFAEIQVEPNERTEHLIYHYGKLIDLINSSSIEKYSKVYKRIIKILDSPDWRLNLSRLKNLFKFEHVSDINLEISETLLDERYSQIIESIFKINKYIKINSNESALEEAYSLINRSPGYMPLQLKIADLMLNQNRIEEALEKLVIISQVYFSRGKLLRAKKLLLQVLETSPFNLDARSKIINIFRELEDFDNVLEEILIIADTQYKLANFELAKASYLEAYKLADKLGNKKKIKISTLSKMADLDAHSMNWNQALEYHKAICELDPADMENWKNIINLNLKLGNDDAANSELNECIRQLKIHNPGKELIFIKDYVADYPNMIFARKKLAEQYIILNKTIDAIAELDQVIQLYIEVGDIEETRKVVKSVLELNPENETKYLNLLRELEN